MLKLPVGSAASSTGHVVSNASKELQAVPATNKDPSEIVLHVALQQQTDHLENCLQAHTQRICKRIHDLELRLALRQNGPPDSRRQESAASYLSHSSAMQRLDSGELHSGVFSASARQTSFVDEGAMSEGPRLLSDLGAGLGGPSPRQMPKGNASQMEAVKSVKISVWPPKFSVNDAWKDDMLPYDAMAFDEDEEGSKTLGKDSQGLTPMGQHAARMGQSDSALEAPPSASACMLRPSSWTRLAWDLTGLALIFWDILSVPFFLAFEDAPETTFTITMFWVTLLFWTADISLSFNTGIYRHGAEELRRCRVTWHYIRTWLILDLLMVSFDWAGIAVSGNSDGSGVLQAGKGVRGLKVVRSLRLLRLMKLRRILEDIQDHIISEPMYIGIKMGKLTFIVLLLCHLVACIWYGFGTFKDEHGYEGWSMDATITERTILYRYSTSLHWALTQFTPASMEITPNNTQERLFAVVVLIFALLVFSSFLSSITAAMTQLRQMSNKADKNVSLLRRYLKSRSIPNSLTVRILRYVEHKMNQSRNQIQEHDVALLRVLSKPLQNELMKEIYQPSLSRHPFFLRFAKADNIAMQRICNTAVFVLPMSASDTLFTHFSSATQMYICLSGKFHYKLKRIHSQEEVKESKDLDFLSAKSPSPSPRSVVSALPLPRRHFRRREKQHWQQGTGELHVGDWCCEGALWTQWLHLGTLKATAVSEVLSLDASRFAEAAAVHQQAFRCVLLYCRLFVQYVTEAALQGRLSDLGRTDQARLEDIVETSFARDPVNRLASSTFTRALSNGSTSARRARQVAENLRARLTVNSSRSNSFSTHEFSSVRVDSPAVISSDSPKACASRASSKPNLEDLGDMSSDTARIVGSSSSPALQVEALPVTPKSNLASGLTPRAAAAVSFSLPPSPSSPEMVAKSSERVQL